MVERRTLIIEERESLTFPRTLIALHLVYLPTGYDVDLEDVSRQIRLALDEAGAGDGFSIFLLVIRGPSLSREPVLQTS